MTNLCFRFLRGGERRLFALLLAITLSVPSFAFAADEASESNAYSAAPARAERLIAKGKVIDPNGQPVAGVAVIIDETKTGTVTDGNGYYVIDVPNVGVHLTFTCLGYKPQTAVVPKSLSLDIYMEEDTLEMDAAVVVGMGHQRKASVIGAISSVSRDALKIPQRNLTNALAGKIAGAVVVQRTGEPGLDNAEFWIRGISSLNSSAPLVLVDGVERSMSDLSIEEIETISVLKDASATAVYGVRAANGVVLVTTRKGIAQKATIDVKIESGISNLVNMPKLLDGANYMRLYNEAYGSEFYSPEQIRMTETHADPYLYPNVNWFDELFTKFSTNSQVSVNVRGGGERARYYVTASYLRDNGNLYNNPDTDYNTKHQHHALQLPLEHRHVAHQDDDPVARNRCQHDRRPPAASDHLQQQFPVAGLRALLGMLSAGPHHHARSRSARLQRIRRDAVGLGCAAVDQRG